MVKTHNKEKHKEVMEILEWAKGQNLITFNICNFVVSQQWASLKELRDNPELVPTCTTSIYTDD